MRSIFLIVAALFTVTALAQDPIPPPPGFFSLQSLAAKGKVDVLNAAAPGIFTVTAEFVLSQDSDWFFPGQEDMTLETRPHHPEGQGPATSPSLIAVPAGCLEQRKNGTFEMRDFRSCGFKWWLEIAGNEKMRSDSVPNGRAL